MAHPVSPDQVEQWKFLFDLHGVLAIPDALSPQHVDDLNALLDAHIEADTANDWQTLRFPVVGSGSPQSNDEPVTLLDWGKPMRDCLCVPGIVDMCDAIIGLRFRLDHIYLVRPCARPPARPSLRPSVLTVRPPGCESTPQARRARQRGKLAAAGPDCQRPPRLVRRVRSCPV